MKKSIFLVMGVCILCVSAMFLSCDNDSSTGGNGGEGGDAAHPSSLVGRWNATDGEMSLLVTTNSNQTAVDQFAQCTGNIAVTGNQNATLTYMAAYEEDGDLFVLASNISIWEIMSEGGMMMKANGSVMKSKNNMMMHMKQTSAGVPLPLLKTDLTYPVHLFVVMEEMAMYATISGPNDTTMYAGTSDGITYNSGTYTLSAQNVTLMGLLPPSPTITLNGQMQNTTINVPANTPTNVMTTPMPDDVGQTIVLDADGAFMAISTFDSIVDTSYGTWAVTGKNTLTIVEYDTVDGTPETYTSDATYALNGNNLDITVDEDACEEDTPEDVQDCLNDIEAQFGLDEDSLISATDLMEMSFTKVGAAKL